MNRNQAKEILLRYRPGTADADEADVKAALDFAQQDAELAGWLNAHLVFQKSVRASLRSVQVPADLRQRILDGVESSRKPAVIWLRSPSLWAAAAAIVLLLGLSLWWMNPREDLTFIGFRERMVGTVRRNYPIQLLSRDLGEIRRYLSERQVHGDYQLTRSLEQVRGYGCAALSWQNHKIAMVCFEPAAGQQLYLFVADPRDVPNAPTSASPEFQRVRGFTTATWVRGNKLYLLAGEVNEAALGRFLDP